MTEKIGFGTVFAMREFRAIWAAYALSTAGDQLTRVALAILVFNRTDSAWLTALTYALTFIPSIFGGALLSGLADRFPRRTVMVISDLCRAGLVAVMAIPRMPLALICVLLVFVVLLGAPFRAAQAAALPDILPGERFEVGLAIRNITQQVMQLVAFAGGGLLITVITPNGALALDAVTFLLSAALVKFGMQFRPPPAGAEAGAPESAAGKAVHMMRGGMRAIWEDPALRSLTALVLLTGLLIAPEGLAAPYAQAIGHGTVGTGLLMAADPAGSALGAFLFAKLVPAHLRSRLIGPLALLAAVPLMICVIKPGLVPAMLLWAVTGALGTAYVIQSNASFTRRVPDARRGQASGLIATALLAAQGVGVLIAGVIAEFTGVFNAVAIAGVLAVVLGIGPAATWRRVNPDHAPGTGTKTAEA
ncbi:MFS transporter [Labedaea rhizosphaerae]|uniref:MFS transporter n=2 Tax=Labedaea rhizosphaerae TaxID=598644 RepID=A0A4R6SPV6_LABRH|nr:MFS transporter [Labedaea rhizosphaerae]